MSRSAMPRQSFSRPLKAVRLASFTPSAQSTLWATGSADNAAGASQVQGRGLLHFPDTVQKNFPDLLDVPLPAFPRRILNYTPYVHKKNSLTMKYVIGTSGEDFLPFRIRVFSEHETHRDIWEEMKSRGNVALFSAGFAEMQRAIFRCHGESTSLGVGSHINDSEILNRFLND